MWSHIFQTCWSTDYRLFCFAWPWLLNDFFFFSRKSWQSREVKQSSKRKSLMTKVKINRSRENKKILERRWDEVMTEGVWEDGARNCIFTSFSLREFPYVAKDSGWSRITFSHASLVKEDNHLIMGTWRIWGLHLLHPFTQNFKTVLCNHSKNDHWHSELKTLPQHMRSFIYGSRWIPKVMQSSTLWCY